MTDHRAEAAGVAAAVAAGLSVLEQNGYMQRACVKLSFYLVSLACFKMEA